MGPRQLSALPSPAPGPSFSCSSSFRAERASNCCEVRKSSPSSLCHTHFFMSTSYRSLWACLFSSIKPIWPENTRTGCPGTMSKVANLLFLEPPSGPCTESSSSSLILPTPSCWICSHISKACLIEFLPRKCFLAPTYVGDTNRCL